MDKLGGNKYVLFLFSYFFNLKYLKFSYEIFETITDSGLNSELLLRSTQRTDGTIYKCDAENEHGKDERSIKLVIVGELMNILSISF